MKREWRSLDEEKRRYVSKAGKRAREEGLAIKKKAI